MKAEKNRTLSYKRLLSAFLVTACLLAACVSQVPQTKDSLSAEASSQGTGKTAGPAENLPSGNGLGSSRFRDLPPEAKEYLETLAGAFRKRDKGFLISQGEAQYERELRSRYDEGTYLALLYRIGPYSEDMEWKSPAPVQLDTSTVQAIEYSGWEEKGPMLEIKGRLYFVNSVHLPCAIMLVWRLPEPRILGEWP